MTSYDLTHAGNSGGTTLQEVSAFLLECLERVVGADTVALLHVGEKTKLFVELGLSSIDMARIAEMLDERYNIAEQLVGWLSERPIRTLARFTVGDLRDFIYHALD